MGKITSALKKAAEERMSRIERVSRIKEHDQLIVKKIGGSLVDPAVVTYFDPKALISEQYKILRTNILSLNKGNPPRAMVVTSSIQSEGKTITSLNLAVSLSQAVHKPKVLLIDADMRKGRVHKYLGVKQPVGLSELLQGKAELDQCLFHIDIENLAFIACGSIPDHPADLLASEAMRHFLSTMRKQFDFVLIDTPPVISVADAGIVGNMVDGVLLVVQAGRTQRGIVKRAEESLYQSHCKVIGTVLSNIEYHLPEYIYRYL
jgi:capsular exopolysaccharide synthesis family protein